MSEHSPGPWHCHVNAAGDLDINTPAGDTVVHWYESDLCLSPGDPTLIAAAPEMLALLVPPWDRYVCDAAFDDNDDARPCDGLPDPGLGNPCWEHQRRALLARIGGKETGR